MSLQEKHIRYWILGVLFSTLACAGCSRSEYAVLDSGVQANFFPQTYWMDDYRVMFYAKNRLGQGIFIWDTRANVVTKYADAVWKVCYDRDTQYIYYGVKQEKGFIHVKHGRMGEEALEVVPNTDENTKRLGWLNPITCVPRERPDDDDERHYLFLKPSHGYITSEAGPKRQMLRRYTNGDGRQYLLPNFFQTVTGFYEWQSAYFVWHSGSHRGGWLYPERGFEEVVLESPRKNMSGSTLAYPVRNGFLYISHDIDSVSDAGKSGIYLYRNDTYTWVLAGSTNALSTSPSGCKAAFVNEPSLEEAAKGKRTVKMIDFCRTTEK